MLTAPGGTLSEYRIANTSTFFNESSIMMTNANSQHLGDQSLWGAGTVVWLFNPPPGRHSLYMQLHVPGILTGLHATRAPLQRRESQAFNTGMT